MHHLFVMAHLVLIHLYWQIKSNIILKQQIRTIMEKVSDICALGCGMMKNEKKVSG